MTDTPDTVFLRDWRTFKAGDAVPDTVAAGVVKSLTARGVVGSAALATDAPAADPKPAKKKRTARKKKAVRKPPEDKSLGTEDVENK